MQTLIELNKVSKHYQLTEHLVKALNNVSLTIFSGDFVAILGASGSGKSTLMNILGLLDQPTLGEYKLNQQLVSHLTGDAAADIRNHQIGFIFQSFFLLPRLSAIENVMLPLLYRQLPREVAKEKAYLALKKMHIADKIKHKPSQLSGGQQQRVAIARALVTEPTIILADEPTGALDGKTSGEVMSYLKELHENEKRTIIIITHDEKVSRVTQKQFYIQDGCLV